MSRSSVLIWFAWELVNSLAVLHRDDDVGLHGVDQACPQLRHVAPGRALT